jgi:hypothetical protein
MALPSNVLQTLRWRVGCAACDWSMTVEALVPYGPDGHAISTQDTTAPAMVVSGFWEDYCCPTHLQCKRRRVHISDAGVPLDDAYTYLFAEQVRVEAVPRCSTCGQLMQAGPVLENLPYHLQPTIELLQWAVTKLQALQHLATTEQRAVQHGDTTIDTAQQLLSQELQLLQRFYRVMHREFNVNPNTVPFLQQVPAILEAWNPALDDILNRLARRDQQLQQRQHKENSKQAGMCPNCQQQSVFLMEAKTI